MSAAVQKLWLATRERWKILLKHMFLSTFKNCDGHLCIITRLDSFFVLAFYLRHIESDIEKDVKGGGQGEHPQTLLRGIMVNQFFSLLET